MSKIVDGLIDQIAKIIDPYAFRTSFMYELPIDKEDKVITQNLARVKSKLILELIQQNLGTVEEK